MNLPDPPVSREQETLIQASEKMAASTPEDEFEYRRGPTWLGTILGVIAGWIAATAVLFALALGLSWLGFPAFNDLGGVLKDLYSGANVIWAMSNIAMHVSLVMVGSFVTTLVISAMIGRAVSFWWIFVVLLVLGGLPIWATDFPWWWPASWNLGILALLPVVRYIAAGSSPPGSLSHRLRLSRTGFALLVWGTAAALGWLVAYGATHPLTTIGHGVATTVPAHWEDGTHTGTRSYPSVAMGPAKTIRVKLSAARQTVYYQFPGLDNSGPFSATITGFDRLISDPRGAAVRREVRTDVLRTVEHPDPSRNPLPKRMDAHSIWEMPSPVIGIEFNCKTSKGRAITAEALKVRYRLLGRNWGETVPLVEKLQATCPGR